MNDPSERPEEEGRVVGFDNIGIEIIEIGEDEGEVDYTVRPLRESLRKLIRPEARPESDNARKEEGRP